MGYFVAPAPDSEELIFTWANEYMAQNYTVVGFVNISPIETDYFFGDVPQSVETLEEYILIYRRNLEVRVVPQMSRPRCTQLVMIQPLSKRKTPR